MSTIKVDTIATRTGSGNITASNTIAGTSATLSGTLGVTGTSTLSSGLVMTSDDPTITMTDSSGTNDIGTIQSTSGALILTARDGSADGEIIFKKTDGSATDETMRIKNDGNVGMGTTSPSTPIGKFGGSAKGLAVKAGQPVIAVEASANSQYVGYLGQAGTNTYLGAVGGGSLIFQTGTSGSTAAYILSSGNVGIGTDQNAHGLSIYRHLQQYGGLMLQNGTNNTGQVFQAFHNYAGTRIGSVSQNNSAVVYNTSSDYRLKENVSYTFDATSRLKQLKPARFNWISDDTNTTIDGFLAHEVSGIVPEAITGEKDGTQDLGTVKDADGNVIETNLSETFFTERKKETVDKDGNTETPMYPSDYVWVKTATEDVYQGIDQAKLVPLLVKTIQELEARITALESE